MMGFGRWLGVLGSAGLLALGLTYGCGSDDTDADPAGSGGDSGTGGESGSGNAGSGGSGGAAGSGGSGGSDVDPVLRGQYLVTTVSVCVDCHTPRLMDGSPDMDNFLAGVNCFADVDPMNDEVGCISTSNLTDHETGLKNRSDDEIKDMFLKGLRPDGKAMHSFMPYWMYGNMKEADADAIVAYLRTVDGVDHQVTKHQPPFDMPPEKPTPLIDLDAIHTPSEDDDNYESAMRGRYLATSVSPCLECHTEDTEEGGKNWDKAFAGGAVFPRESLGLPDTFPAEIVSQNLTQHETGLEGWTAKQIIKAIKEGVDKDDRPICPPMPAGPMGPFANLAAEDLTDIANYLLTLPGIENEIPLCEMSK